MPIFNIKVADNLIKSFNNRQWVWSVYIVFGILLEYYYLILDSIKVADITLICCINADNMIKSFLISRFEEST